MRGALVAVALVALAGCSEPEKAAPPPRASRGVDLDAALAKARAAGEPSVVSVFEDGRDPLDGPAIEGVATISIDLAVSANRAQAARYHPTKTPVLVCHSVNGVIASRDEGPLTRELVQQRVAELRARGPELDSRLAELEKGTSVEARLALADFLRAHENFREAIPVYEPVARAADVAVPLRVRAWVNLARCHLLSGEAEKGRHEADALAAELGPRSPEAVAGRNLVHGIQDGRTRRFAKARAELEAAIAAAPTSPYAREAREVLATLPAR